MSDKGRAGPIGHAAGTGLERVRAVLAIPCTVLIDAKGIVQAVHVGFMPGQEEKLTESLERLLQGESLLDREELERERAEGAPGGRGAQRPTDP